MKSLVHPDNPLTGRALRAQQAHIRKLRANVLPSMGAGPSGGAPRQATAFTAESATRYLGGLLSRAKVVMPAGGRRDAITEWLARAIEQVNSGEQLRDRGEVLMAARAGDPEAIKLRAAMVVTSVQNLLQASAGWSAFFDMQVLGDEDWPIIEVASTQEIKVEAIGEDGGMQTVQAQLAKKQFYIPLFMLWTEWFEYPLRDLYKGHKVKSLALANIDMARDFAAKIEDLLATYILVGGANTRLTATFTTTGDEVDRHYDVHSRVNTGNFPVGNLVTLTNNTTTTNFRKDVLDAALEYCEKWGGDAFPDGALDVVGIRVCSADIGAWRSQVTLTSESNSLTEQIFTGGAVLNYAGKRFVLEADNTIEPNDGVAYVRLNKPIGVQFEKTSMAETLIDESPERIRSNRGRICQGSAFGFGMPLPWAVNILGVRYRTPS